MPRKRRSLPEETTEEKDPLPEEDPEEITENDETDDAMDSGAEESEQKGEQIKKLRHKFKGAVAMLLCIAGHDDSIVVQMPVEAPAKKSKAAQNGSDVAPATVKETVKAADIDDIPANIRLADIVAHIESMPELMLNPKVQTLLDHAREISSGITAERVREIIDVEEESREFDPD